MALHRAFGDEIAHHDHAGGDADARLQMLRGGGLQARRGGGDGERGTHRALGLVFVRLRPAEVGEHAIAEELRDMALKARNLARHRVLKATDQLTQIFRIELGGQRRRADQIDEHHGELAALGG